MCLEIMRELLHSVYYGQDGFLQWQVMDLCLLQRITHIIEQFLHSNLQFY